MNLFELDIDDSFDFFCPMTGEQILGPDFFHPSAATVFTFSPEASDFESIAEPFKTIWDEIESLYGEDEFGTDLWDRFCERLAKEFPNVLVFGFTTHGIACGPVSNTIFVAIDFAFGGDDDEDLDE
jgi:hypothetical protein